MFGQPSQGIGGNLDLGKALPAVSDDPVLAISFAATQVKHQPVFAHNLR